MRRQEWVSVAVVIALVVVPCRSDQRSIPGSVQVSPAQSASSIAAVGTFQVIKDFRTRTGHSFLAHTDRIFEDAQGRYWAASNFGLAVYEPQEDRWTRINLDIPWGRPPLLGQTRDGRILYGPAKPFVPSLFEFDGKNWPTVVWPGGKPKRDKDVPTAFSGKDVSWFVFDGKLIAYDGKNWTKPIRLPDIDGTQFNYGRGLEDRDGDIWLDAVTTAELTLRPFETEKKGEPTGAQTIRMGWRTAVVRLTLAAGPPKVFFHGKGSEPIGHPEKEWVVRMYEDRRGRLWFGGYEGFAYVYDKRDGSWMIFELRRTLQTEKPVIVRLPDVINEFGMKVPRQVPPDFRVYSICEDAAGRMLFGTLNGLVVFDERAGKWTQYVPENSGLSSREILSLYRDRSSRIWVGTSYGVMVLE